MAGRSGHDALNYALMLISVIFLSISLVVFHRLFTLLSWSFFLLVVYRYFSKNLYARNRENKCYQRTARQMIMKIKQGQRVLLDHKHVYFLCPTCGRMLRVPKGKGTVKVTCSYCYEVFIKKS